MHYVLGVDIGGTFTDFSLLDDAGEITLWKEATTPKEPSQAVQKGLQALAKTHDRVWNYTFVWEKWSRR